MNAKTIVIVLVTTLVLALGDKIDDATTSRPASA